VNDWNCESEQEMAAGSTIKFIILIGLRKEREKDTNATVTSTRDGDQI